MSFSCCLRAPLELEVFARSTDRSDVVQMPQLTFAAAGSRVGNIQPTPSVAEVGNSAVHGSGGRKTHGFFCRGDDVG